MTFDQCDEVLAALRRTQGTSNPRVRVDLGGVAYRGRVARAGSDPELRSAAKGPFGVLVLENLGLGRGPRTVLQIADIPDDGIKPIDE